MGYSPLDGLTMGTRTGGIDGNAVLRLASEFGIEEAAALLNRRSGLLALGGRSDMRALQESDTAQARFAIAHFCYWAIRHAGSMIAAMGGLDALAFTGGIGENDSAVRARIMSGLAWLGMDFTSDGNMVNSPQLHIEGSRIDAWIVPANEERTIAADALAVMHKAVP
jgi:acetate kinase